MESKEEQRTLSPEEAAEQIAEEAAKRKQLLTDLARKIEDEFQLRAQARTRKESEWRHCLQLYNSPLTGSSYINPDKPFEKIEERARPVPNIVRTKCDIAVANSISMQFAAGDKNWDLWPPASDPSQETADRCRGMEKEIQTQLDGCGYAIKSRRAMHERVVLGTGILKGPINADKLKTSFVKRGDMWAPEMAQDSTPSIEHVLIWNFYPDMSVTTHEQSQSDIELHPMSKLDISLLRKNKGFQKDVIDEILSSSELGNASFYNTNRFPSITEPMWAQPHMYKDRYVVLEYHGPITYDILDKLGLIPSYKEPTEEYYGEVWVCAGKVIRIELENIEGAFESPYAVAVWKPDPTSPFGFGNPLILADAQRVTTACYHMILDNASLTSGPQVAMYQQYIQPVDGQWQLSPNKVWLLTDPTVKVDDAIKFFNPTNVIGNIMPVLELARMFAEEESATPATIAGLSSPGAADSATGQLVMQRNSTVLLDYMSEEWDDYVTEKVIRRMYAWNMQYNPKEEIKGDYKIDVRTSSEYKNKLMHVRDLEKISVEASQNKDMAMWINTGELQRARLALMALPSSKIIRSREEYEAAAQQAQQQQQQDPAMMEIQIKAATLEVEKEKLAIERERLKFELVQQQQREQWDHEERQGANYARIQEAQASVIRAQLESQTEMLKLMQKKEATQLDQQTKLMIKENDAQAKVFIEGMKQKKNEVDQLLTAKELALKEQTGTGI